MEVDSIPRIRLGMDDRADQTPVPEDVRLQLQMLDFDYVMDEAREDVALEQLIDEPHGEH